jgi:beta propeller repeat protein
MKNIIRSLGLLLALGVLAVPAFASITMTEQQLSIDANTDQTPRISGTDTVWATNQTGTFDVERMDVNGALSLPAFGAGDQTSPDIDEGFVVFSDTSAGGFNIGLVDLATSTRSYITFDTANNSQPAVSGDTVVYTTDLQGTLDVFGYTISTGQVFAIADTAAEESHPAVNNGLVAWDVFQNGSYDVMASDVGGTPFVVAASTANEQWPSVSGDRIAYIINGDVAVYDRITAASTAITSDAFNQQNVVIDGDHVAWSDDRNGNYDIFLYDLTDGTTYQITSDPSDQILGDLEADRLVYYDNRNGNYDVFQTTFTINHAPLADAGADQSVAVGSTVQLAGTATDVDGDAITSWSWTLDSAPTGSGAALSDPSIANPSFSADLAGTYVLSLVVSDGTDVSVPSTVTITAAPNLPPTALLTADVTTGLAPLTVTFDRNIALYCGPILIVPGTPLPTFDPECYLQTVTLDFGDGSAPETAAINQNGQTLNSSYPTVSHTYTAAGSYLATLTATDNIGQTATDTVLIEVTAPNTPPTASPTATPNSGTVPLNVAFAANAADADGDPLSYDWDFGDPTSGAANTDTSADPGHTYNAAGQYSVTLTVSDGIASTTSSLTVNVEPAVVGRPLSVRKAVVAFHPRKGHEHDEHQHGGTGKLRAEFDTGTHPPEPGDVFRVVVDGVTVIDTSFGQFHADDDDPLEYVYKARHLMAKLDLGKGTAMVYRSRMDLRGIDPANGLEVVLTLGGDTHVEVLDVREHHHRLTYIRDDLRHGDHD